MDPLAAEMSKEWTYPVREQLRAVAFAILAFGLVLTLVSVFADPLALGMPGSGFGWKQISGTVIGLGISSLGMWLIIRFSDDDESDS